MSPPKGWPKEGQLELKDLGASYRQYLPNVLNQISCKIKPCEKIGIVGRTGSGKSSLFLTLFRLLEPNEGSVEIDGVNTLELGLYTLRSALSIIPQVIAAPFLPFPFCLICAPYMRRNPYFSARHCVIISTLSILFRTKK